MDIRRDEIRTLFVAQELHKIPQWVKSEHMEKCISLKELCKYSEDDVKKKKAIIAFFKKWRKRWFKKKHRIVCVNEAAMERIADDLIERGYHAEREVGIHPFPGTQMMIYAVIYWKE